MGIHSQAQNQRHFRKYNAYFVAKGFKQNVSVDFNETFALVAKILSICLLLAHAHTPIFYVTQGIVMNASRNGSLDKRIFMSQSDGFVYYQHPQFVRKLIRTLYELKQAAHRFVRCSVKH